MLARSSTSKSYTILSIKQPFSFFDFVDSYSGGLHPLRRLLSQVRLLGGKTMVVEEVGKADDIEEENDDIRKIHPKFTESKSVRLSFFSKPFSTKRGLTSADNKEFIGYAIIKTDVISSSKKTRIYESVIHPSKRPNNCIRGAQKWACSILNNKFIVNGYLYAQQNNITNVCAHVALRTAAARYHKNGDMSYREMNNIVGIDHVNKKVNKGLTSIEMVKILEAAGANCFVGDFTGTLRASAPFQKYLYGSIESGFPAIIFFGTTYSSNSFHAIPVFGHTFNEDTWAPNADFSYFKIGSRTRYVPSESWLSMFIAHDDNWGSNFCIPRRYLHTKRICTKLGKNPLPCPMETEGVAYVISTMPKSVKMRPIDAEVIAADYLLTMLPQIPAIQNPWYERLKKYANMDMLVLRPIIITPDDYTRHLYDVRDWNGKNIRRDIIEDLKMYLQDEFYWLIELSIPELFPANRRKVGEILIRAKTSSGQGRNMKNFVIARLPSHFALYESGGSSKPKYQFIPSGVASHVELYIT